MLNHLFGPTHKLALVNLAAQLIKAMKVVSISPTQTRVASRAGR